jgi:hypothetical protein
VTPDQSDVRGRSYLRYFGIVASLFLAAVTCAAVALTRGISELRWVAAGLFISAGCVPALLQWRLGFALDRSWVARYGRTTEPRQYWAMMFLAVMLAVFWGYLAIGFARS